MAIYQDEKLVKRAYSKVNYTKEQLDELRMCCDSVTGPLYFISNFMYIQHPVRGREKLSLYNFQKDLIHNYHTYRKSINMVARQCGKTTVAAAYLLWYAMFNNDATVLIAAHKYDGAQEIMQRVRYAYESVPDHIRDGVKTYNKRSMEFANGSRIVATTTTENTGRGMSLSLIYLDELSFVDQTIAQAMWTSLSPTLSTGGKCIITSTPDTDENQFADIWFGANKLVDTNGNETEVGSNGFRPYMAIWSAHPERDQNWAEQERAALGDDRFLREHECCAHTTVITLRDNFGNIFDMTMGDFFNLCKSPNKIS